MSVPTLRQGAVTVRPARPSDIEDRLAIGVVPEFVRLCGGVPDPNATLTREQAEAWYRRTSTEPYGWCIEVGDRCIGAARLHSMDQENRRARYAIGIYDPAAWGHGYGTATTRLILNYAFETLGLHRVDLRVLADNTRAVTCYSHCGFVQEGLEREGTLIDGVWCSDIMMSILEDEFRRASAAWSDE